MGTWSEILNGCERGTSDGFFLGDLWLYPNKGMWERFLSEIPDGPLAFSGGAWWDDLVGPGDFFDSCGHALCECHDLTLQEDKKGI